MCVLLLICTCRMTFWGQVDRTVHSSSMLVIESIEDGIRQESRVLLDTEISESSDQKYRVVRAWTQSPNRRMCPALHEYIERFPGDIRHVIVEVVYLLGELRNPLSVYWLNIVLERATKAEYGRLVYVTVVALEKVCRND